MKQCPRCRTTYTDETLRYCLADGTPLENSTNSVTTVFPGKTDQIRVEIPPTQAAMPYVTPAAEPEPAGRWIKIIIGVLVLGALGLGLVFVVGAFIYFNSGGRESTVTAKSPTPTATPPPTPDTEKQKLEDELANLQKRLEEQKRSAVNTNPFPSDPGTQKNSATTATVNSPNDGFLALRSLPDADFGERIAKIPHGSTVGVISCADDRVTIGTRTGRWCLITYKSYAGFAVDAFLDY